MIRCCEGEVHYCCLKSYGVFYFSNVWWDHIPDTNCMGVKGEHCSCLCHLCIEENKIGPRTEPCGSPDVTHVLTDRVPLTETLCFRCERNYFIQFLVFPIIPQKANFDMRHL